MKKYNIYYPYPRRKWENDLVNNRFELFEINPKANINFDEEIDFNNNLIKRKLKKIKYVRKLLKFRNYLREKSNSYIPKLKIKDAYNYDGIISTQSFFNINSKNKKPYVCYIENSHSILGYDYSKYQNIKYTDKMKREIKECINDESFKGFIFYSYRSQNGFYKYYHDIIPDNYKFLDVIYPYVKDNKLVNEKSILTKVNNIYKNPIELLYISSMFSLKGGCEIIEAFAKLRDKYDIKLNIVTNIDTIPLKYKSIINSSNDIIVYENKLNNDKLQQLYSKCHILLHPTFMDSTAIVIMEALKAGLPVITTDTFAIPEFINHGENGFLIENPIKFWDMDYKIQEPDSFFGSVKTAYLLDKYKSNTLYNYFIENIYEYTIEIINNYKKFALNAYNMSMKSQFSEKSIYNKWNDIICSNLLNTNRRNI